MNWITFRTQKLSQKPTVSLIYKKSQNFILWKESREVILSSNFLGHFCLERWRWFLFILFSLIWENVIIHLILWFFLARLKLVHVIIVIDCQESVLWRAPNGYRLGIGCNLQDIMYFTTQSYWLQKTLQMERSLLLPLKKKSCAKCVKYLIYALVLMTTDSWLFLRNTRLLFEEMEVIWDNWEVLQEPNDCNATAACVLFYSVVDVPTAKKKRGRKALDESLKIKKISL